MREIDRRKLAAAKPARDAKAKRQREQWRAAKKRQRSREAKETVTAKRPQRESERLQNAAQKAKLFNELFGPVVEPKENAIKQDLLRLSRDRKAPASARVTALRTLAEMDGHIGRLQQHGQETADQNLASLTRQQLEEELKRLRALVAS
jgi:hypothetical protein